MPDGVTAKTLQFIGLLLTAIALAAGLAHVFELPHKIALPREQYLVVQQIYRGWQWIGIAIVGALIASAALAVMWRGSGTPFGLAVVAAVCIGASLIVFFAITFPINQATSNWTVLPGDWEALRRRWEVSHAIDAALYFAAFVALALSAFVERP